MEEIARLPVDRQVEALIEFLTAVLARTPVDALRAKRNALMTHFSHCGCSLETCAALLEWVDLHLARRERDEPAPRPRLPATPPAPWLPVPPGAHHRRATR